MLFRRRKALQREPEPAASNGVLPSEILRKVRRVELKTRRLVNESMAGEYHSVFKGRGMEFAEVREYRLRILDEIPDAELVAVCDNDNRRFEKIGNLYPHLKFVGSLDSLLKDEKLDAVVIATPHYQHPPMAIQAFRNGFHVLIEKPAGAYTRQVREMNEAAEKSGKVFGIMFQQRAMPVYRKLKDLVDAGASGISGLHADGAADRAHDLTPLQILGL